MFHYCDVYGWRGHYFNTPLHAGALDSVDVVLKCRCGETRNKIVRVPLPDTEEFEKYHAADYDSDEEVIDDEESGYNLGGIIRIIIVMIVMLVIMTAILPMFVDIASCVKSNLTC